VPEIRRVVDEIRFYLDSNEAEMTGTVREAAIDYADACRQANQRLRRCGEFLNRNLRSEAIQLAEAEPDLLEVVTILDLPERERWEQIASMYDLPSGEPLLLEIAEAINEAYALQEPLKRLLDKHRFLALSRASIKQRLAILWKLVEHDGTLGTWETDASEMERARIAAIEAEAREAARRRDTQALEDLIDEIDNGKWIESLPANLRKTIVQFARESAVVEARAKVQELADSIVEAHADADMPRARQLKQQWDQLQSAANLDAYDPVFARVGPAFRWIADADALEETVRKRERAAAALNRAIGDGSTGREELGRLRSALARLDPAIPEAMAARYAERLAQIERGVVRRRRLKWAGAIGSSFVAVILAALVGWWTLRTAESRRTARTLSQLVSDGQLAAARELAEAHKDVAPTAEWHQAVRSLSEAEAADKARRGEFGDVTAALGRAGSYDDARPKLSRAAELASTTEEKSQIRRLESEWEERHRKEVVGQEAQIRDKIEAVVADLSRAEEMFRSSGPSADLDALLEQLAPRVGQLPALTAGTDAKAEARIAPLGVRLKGLREAAQKEERKRDLLAEIRKHSSFQAGDAGAPKQVAEYMALLGTFAKLFPEDALAADYRLAPEEAGLYQGICEWQRLIGRWSELLPANVTEARRRAGECDEFNKKYHGSPIQPLVQRYSFFCSAIVRREEGEGGNKAEGLVSKLRELYSGPLMQDVSVIWDKEGTAYYLKKEVDFSGQNVANFQYVSDFLGKLHPKNIETRALKSAVSVPAPQCKLAETAGKELDRLSIANWEAKLQELTRAVVEASDLDPFLRYALLRYTLEYAAAGSEGLGYELRKALDIVHDPSLDLSTRWMVPNDSRANAARADAKRLLARISDLDGAWTRAEKSRMQFARELFVRCTFAGALAHDGKEGWTCAGSWKPDGEYELFVAVPAVDQTTAHWATIGRARAGRVEISQRETSSDLRPGRLVLARPAPSSGAEVHTSGTAWREASK